MQPLVQTIQRDSAITFPMFGNLTINPPSYFTVFGMDIYFYGVIIGLGLHPRHTLLLESTAAASA